MHEPVAQLSFRVPWGNTIFHVAKNARRVPPFTFRMFGSAQPNPSRHPLGSRQNYMGHGHGIHRTPALNETTCTRTSDLQARRWFTCIRAPWAQEHGQPGVGLIGSAPGPQDSPGHLCFRFPWLFEADSSETLGTTCGRVWCTGGPCPVRIPNWGSGPSPILSCASAC